MLASYIRRVIMSWTKTNWCIQYTVIACSSCKISIMGSLIPIDAFVTPDDVKMLDINAFTDVIRWRVFYVIGLAMIPRNSSWNYWPKDSDFRSWITWSGRVYLRSQLQSKLSALVKAVFVRLTATSSHLVAWSIIMIPKNPSYGSTRSA